MPLRSRSAVLQTPASSRRVSTQLTRNRRRRSPQPTRDLTKCAALSMMDRDLLSLDERWEATRKREKTERPHPATLAKPACPDRRGHTGRDGGFLARDPTGDRYPECLAMLPASGRRPARRTHTST